jgi:hypothetical protein
MGEHLPKLKFREYWFRSPRLVSVEAILQAPRRRGDAAKAKFQSSQFLRRPLYKKQLPFYKETYRQRCSKDLIYTFQSHETKSQKAAMFHSTLAARNTFCPTVNSTVVSEF